jgi:hypothetical protein
VTHWSSRLLATSWGSGPSTVARVWAEHDVNPWQTEAFRFSSDPELEARVRDMVGLSLELSAHAIVPCVDEKSQIQALERTQPSRPHAGAARRRHPRGAATHRGRLRALPMTGWAGERPACPHLRKLSQ